IRCDEGLLLRRLCRCGNAEEEEVRKVSISCCSYSAAGLITAVTIQHFIKTIH
ncbi:hypothetical protein L9F63_008378, partial [Diploptera punctata]